MAWFRLVTFKITPAFYGKNSCSLQHKLCLKYQIASFHKQAIDNNRPLIDEEIRNEPDSDTEHNTETENSANLKLKILHAGLNFVPEYGWSKKSIAFGAQSIGLSLASHGLIQDGGSDLVHYFNFMCNENLASYLEEQNSKNRGKKNIEGFVENALENRLKMVVPFAPRWSEAMALMASPLQIPSDLENLQHLVNLIWTYSGSNSSDVTWYTKRISLALCYKLCELSLVQDNSPEFTETFDFLQRRIEMVMNGNQIINQVAATSQLLPHYGSGALITIRNILGIRREPRR